ncbi:hypothetical protein [Saccharothrix coeruleofusca]|uniref:Secreted protein n=1 Tax=Saccharothrix coeruleofusca TaxID=33919 RepID=A0A918AKD2_9PSEU|nr:hypothetical protein [Saccharothrix coeruleofusca]GGP44283.1 hypothetical protein GCM10010185_14990 [Saccharothrix coeruleofusca]
MRHLRARRTAAVAAALAITLTAAAAAPAWAANPPGVASVGSADFTKDGKRVLVPALAACAVDDAPTGSSEPVVASGVRFGAGSSSCVREVVDPAGGITRTRSEAVGRDFELSALVAAGGPRLRVGSWRISCSATDRGTDSAWELGGMSGFADLPAQLPANYAHEVKSRSGVVLAVVTFSEVVLPDPNDGSMSVSLARFRFTPESHLSGEVVLGAAACSPTP